MQKDTSFLVLLKVQTGWLFWFAEPSEALTFLSSDFSRAAVTALDKA